ncbi:MAG: serine hydrolase [Gammaproteobacteria bacterium]|nr:serine hydrolase [Gammaproteobacteria bacterium]MDE0366114.1 serine hydrolase [Gammaproteobacteria bacterium]
MHAWRRFLFVFVIGTGVLSQAYGEGTDDEGISEPPFGLAAVVLTDGEIAKTIYAGRKGTWFGHPVGGDSVFHGASLGKTLASWLALKMVAEGKLELDRALSEYTDGESWAVPPELGNRITLRHVLTHTSGLGNQVAPPNPEVAFEPGSQFQYSGNGFYLLQQAMQAVTGESVEETMRRELFEPLQMVNSSFDPKADPGDEVIPSMPARWAAAVAALMILAGTLSVLAIRLILNKLKPGPGRPLKSGFRRMAAAGVLTTSAIVGVLLGPLYGAYLLLLQLALGGACLAVALVARRALNRSPRYEFGPSTRRALPIAACLLLLGGIYWLGKGQQVPMPALVPAEASPNLAYSLRTTALDLAAFAAEALDDHAAGADEGASLFTVQRPLGQGLEWSLGLATQQTESGRVFWQWGSNPGFESMLAFLPESRSAVIVLTSGFGGREIAGEIARRELGLQTELITDFP